MRSSYIDKIAISKINKELKYKRGLIFFIGTKDYIKFVKPLLSSLKINAKDWLYLLIEIGINKTSNINDQNLIEYFIPLSEDINTKDLEFAFSANIRVSLLKQFVEDLFTNKIIYTTII